MQHRGKKLLPINPGSKKKAWKNKNSAAHATGACTSRQGGLFLMGNLTSSSSASAPPAYQELEEAEKWQFLSSGAFCLTPNYTCRGVHSGKKHWHKVHAPACGDTFLDFITIYWPFIKTFVKPLYKCTLFPTCYLPWGHEHLNPATKMLQVSVELWTLQLLIWSCLLWQQGLTLLFTFGACIVLFKVIFIDIIMDWYFFFF